MPRMIGGYGDATRPGNAPLGAAGRRTVAVLADLGVGDEWIGRYLKVDPALVAVLRLRVGRSRHDET